MRGKSVGKSGVSTPSETEITLGLLNAVEDNSAITQRHAAGELGIALGLVNSYLKRCIKTGLIKVQMAPANRYAYYLTPKGFSEKARLTADFLNQSLNFFRLARTETADLLDMCRVRGWTRIALAGKSELCEITILSAAEHNVDLVGIIDADAAQTTNTFMGIPVGATAQGMGAVHALIITDMKTPQATFDQAIKHFPPDRVLTIPFLRIRRKDESVAPEDGGDA